MESTTEGDCRQRSNVRAGAPWRRHGVAGDAVQWADLDYQLRGIELHRGRAWTDADHETMANVVAQTWGPREANDRATRIPEWWADRFGRNPRQRLLLAKVWDAYVARTGGCRLTHEEWTEILLCSTSSVCNYLRDLEAAGCITRMKTWRPAEGRTGSLLDTIIVRPGPALLEAAAATLKGNGRTRKAAMAKLRERRREGRQRRRQLTGGAWAAREARRARHEARHPPEPVVPKKQRKARPNTTPKRRDAALLGWARRRAELGGRPDGNHLQVRRPDVPGRSSDGRPAPAGDGRPAEDAGNSRTPIAAEPSTSSPPKVDPVDRAEAPAGDGAGSGRWAPAGRSAVARVRAVVEPLVEGIEVGGTLGHEAEHEHVPNRSTHRGGEADLDRAQHRRHSDTDHKICEPPRSSPGGSRWPSPPSGLRRGLAPLRPGEAGSFAAAPPTSPAPHPSPDDRQRQPALDEHRDRPEGRPKGRSSTADDDSPTAAARRIRERAEAAKDAAWAELMARTRADFGLEDLERRPDVRKPSDGGTS